jgi:ribosomal protein L29
VRIKMKVAVSGARDGQPWPGIGGVVDLPDDEAQSYVTAGMATPATDDDVETAVPSTEDVETRELTETEKEADRNAADNELVALRSQAKDAGVSVDKRWGADRLRQEIADAGKTKASK